MIHNGIDTRLYHPDRGTDVLARVGIDPDRPFVLFVGRITRQKGVPHLLRAARALDPEAQLVLCAGAPDTPEIEAEFRELVDELSGSRDGVFWIPEMLPRPDVVQLLSHAAAFVCPSVYEPLGIVNLEAMACGTAVVASAVGGIPEVVDDGSTGLLVPYDERHPEDFESALTETLNRVLDDPESAAAMGAAGRDRAVREFGWDRWPGVRTRCTNSCSSPARRVDGSGRPVVGRGQKERRCVVDLRCSGSCWRAGKASG